LNLRAPILLLAILSLLTGLGTGLSRMGWNLGILETSLHHGAIMVGGFLGTLISLEKVIPLKRKELFTVPVLSGVSVVFFYAGLPVYSFFLLVLASLCLAGVFLYYLTKTRDVIYLLMLGGAIYWCVGNILLTSTRLYPTAFPWWMGFILFIITSERLELTKFLPISRSKKNALIALLFLYPIAILMTFHGGGRWLGGATLVAIAIWLMRYDVIGISIKKPGLQKFIATALFCGYIAMLVTGVLLASSMNLVFGYDAVLHTFFLGFVFSMIFAHGPVILPGVLGLSAKPWHPIMYAWLALLHGSLLVRLVADFTISIDLRKMTGWVSASAIIGYFITVAVQTNLSRRRNAKTV
jgi:hypothetical protein